jgi:hypothetical protein
MKVLFSILGITVAYLIMFTSSGCKKETIVNNSINDTIILNDTIIVNDTVVSLNPITLSVMTANKWMPQEVRGVNGGSIVYYLRGGSANTESFDNEHIQFHANMTGTYVEHFGIIRNVTWNFLNSDNTKLVIHFTNTPGDFAVYWDNIRMVSGNLYFDEYFTDGNTGANVHYQTIRMPKP